MKKFILMFAFMISAFMFTGTYAYAAKQKSNAAEAVTTVYNDSKEAVSTVYTDSKELVKAAYPEVKEAVIAIGSAIGCAAEHVYGVLVKKYIVEGANLAFWALIGMCLFIYGFIKLNRTTSALKVFEWHALIPLIYMAIAGLILSNINFETMFMGLINPEWGAINYILDYTKEMIH